MDKIKLRYKKDKKVFEPEGDVDLPDNFEVEIPGIRTPSLFDKDKLINEIEEDGRKYYPDFKLNEEVKSLLGKLRFTELSNLSDEELRNMYHEHAWKSSNEKYSN